MMMMMMMMMMMAFAADVAGCSERMRYTTTTSHNLSSINRTNMWSLSHMMQYTDTGADSEALTQPSGTY